MLVIGDMSLVSSKWSAYRRATKLAQGGRGVLRMTQVLVMTWDGKRRGLLSASTPIAVPMKELNGGDLYIRPATSDLQNATEFYTYGLHLPVPEAGVEDPRQIVELGCNIGVALTSLSTRFPNATVLGVEPDPTNVALARRNTARFGDRCIVVESAIWDSPAELVVDRSSAKGSYAVSVRPREDADPVDVPITEALDVDSLLAAHMPDGQIDHMVINIEGTEPRVFSKGGNWPSRVRSLMVESHPEFGYSTAECIAQLEQLGFQAWPYTPFPKFVAAIRR